MAGPTTDLPAARVASSGPIPNGILQEGLLAEYRFDEGSGTVVTDYSGNGNTGAYVGSPAFVEGGGFTASGGTQYATGAAGALAGCQTFYIAFDPDRTPGGGIYHTVLGNSSGTTNVNLNIRQDGAFQNPPSPNILCNGSETTGAYEALPGTGTIIALLFDSTGENATRMFINGVEVHYGSTSKSDHAGLAGEPWFGNSNSSSPHAYVNSNIYYFASYSSYHEPGEIASNTQIIRNLMLSRGNTAPESLNATSSSVQVLGVGDSITYGTGSGNPFINNLTATLPINAINVGWPGQSASSQGQYEAPGLASLYPTRFGPRNVAFIFLGTNDLAGSPSSSAVQTTFGAVQNMCQVFRNAGWQVIACTLLSRGSGNTTQWNIDAFNALLRRSWRNVADELCDWANDPALGANNACQNTTWFNSDQVHPTATGQTRMSLYASAALNRLLATGGTFISRYSQVGSVSVTNTTTETSIVGGSAHFNNAAFCNQTKLGTTHTNTTIDGFDTTVDLVAGQSVSGSGLPGNTVISSIASSTSITVSNATATSISGNELTFGNIPVKAGFWLPGKALKFEALGTISTGSSQTLNRKIKLGSTVLASTGAVTLPNSLANAVIEMDATLTCESIGSSANGGTNGTFWIQGWLTVQTTAGAVSRFPIGTTSVVSIDTTVDSFFDVTDTWGAVSSSNSDVTTNLTIYQVSA